MVIKMLIKYGRRIDEHSKNFSKEIENIRKYQTRYNWTGKSTWGIQNQTGWTTRTNQWAEKQSNGNHPNWAAKWKKNLKIWKTP